MPLEPSLISATWPVTGEQHNLASERPAQAHSARDRLLEFRKRFSASSETPAPAQIDSEALAKLHALGYLGFSAANAGHDTAGPDPEARLAEYRQYLRALELSQTGHALEAVATFREILDEDAENLPAHDDLADCYFQLRRFFDATRELRTALGLAPHDVHAEELLGSVWLEVGDKPRARRIISGFWPSRRTTTRHISASGFLMVCRASGRRPARFPGGPRSPA